MVMVDLDGIPIQEFYVSIGIHWDGKKTRTTVHGFREGTSHESMLQDLLQYLHCKGNVVQDHRLGKVIQLRGDWGMAVANHLVNHLIVSGQQLIILEFDGQYNVIRRLW